MQKYPSLMQPDQPLPRVLISARDCGWDSLTGRASPHISPRMLDIPGGQARRASGLTASSSGTHTDAHPPETLLQASPTPASPAESGPLAQPVHFACVVRTSGPAPALDALPAECPQWSSFWGCSPLHHTLLPHHVLHVFSCSQVGVRSSLSVSLPQLPKDLNRCCLRSLILGKCSFFIIPCDQSCGTPRKPPSRAPRGSGEQGAGPEPCSFCLKLQGCRVPARVQGDAQQVRVSGRNLAPRERNGSRTPGPTGLLFQCHRS